MRFTVKAKEFVGPLEIAAAAGATTDVARLHVDAGGVAITAGYDAFTDVAVCKAAAAMEPGCTSFNAKALLKIAKARKRETIEVASDEEGRLVVTTDGPTYQLVTGREAPGARAPTYAHGAAIGNFHEAWRFLRHAIGKDGTRPHLAGPAIDLRSGRLFATDGHRAAIAQVDGTLDVDPVVVHWGLVAVIDKVIKHVSEAIYYTDPKTHQHALQFPGVSVWWRSDVRPPPIDKVTPDAKEAKRVVRFDVQAALAAIKDVTLLMDPREEEPSMRVRLGSDEATLGYEKDGVTTTCSIPITGDGDAVSVLVSPRYLSDALASSGDGEVAFRFFGPQEAMVITRGDFLALVMPTRA